MGFSFVVTAKKEQKSWTVSRGIYALQLVCSKIEIPAFLCLFAVKGSR